MELPTYTSIWRIEKRLYKLYDFRLPMPLPVGQMVVFTAIAIPYVVLLALFGLPLTHTWFWLYVLPPGALTWLATRPVLESKRLPELILSQVRYLAEPATWCRMTALAEPGEIIVVGRVWRRAAGSRAQGRARPGKAAEAAAASAAARTGARPLPEAQAAGAGRVSGRPAPPVGAPARAPDGAPPIRPIAPGPAAPGDLARPASGPGAPAGPPLPAQSPVAAQSPVPAEAVPAELPVAGASAMSSTEASPPRVESASAHPGQTAVRETSVNASALFSGPAAGIAGPLTRLSAGELSSAVMSGAQSPAAQSSVGEEAEAPASPSAAIGDAAVVGPAGREEGAGPAGPEEGAGPAGPEEGAGPAGPEEEAGPGGPEDLDAQVSLDDVAQPAGSSALPGGKDQPQNESTPPVVVVPAQRASARPTPLRPARTVERALSGPTDNRSVSWRDRVAVVPGGRGPGRSDYEQRDAGRAALPLEGPRLVMVLGCTVGAGQTVTTLMLADLLAGLRGQPVAAVDVNPGPASLTEQARTPAITTSTLLAAGLPAPSAPRTRSRGRVDVIVTAAAGEASGDGQLDRVVELLAARYQISLADPGAAAVSAVLALADQLVLVAPASPDAARALAMTREWLSANGHEGLAADSITVINGVSKRSLPHAQQAELVARGQCRAIVRIPWDDRLAEPEAERAIRDSRVRAGGSSRAAQLRPPVRQAYTALAGVLVAALAASPQRRKAAT